MNKIIQKENDLLFKNYIERKYFNLNTNKKVEEFIELIIRPECNQSCSYCYLFNHGEEIYPKKNRTNNKTILKNIDCLLNYLLNELEIKIYQFDLFAGDLFYDNLFFEIMDIFYKYFKNISNDYFDDKHKYLKLVIPCNLSFLKDKNKEIKFEKYNQKMKKINCEIILSYSTDGFYAQDSREKEKLSQDWFDKTLKFCADHNYGVHPMISPENVDKAILNYDWWIENIYKNYNVQKGQDWHPMFVPVRNGNWTQEQIDKYIKYLEYVLYYRLELFDGNIYELAKHLTQNPRDKNNILKTPHLDPLKLDYKYPFQTSINCSLGTGLAINCMSLEIVPCHRLAYPHLCGGKFEIDNNKIIGLKSYKNLSMFINLTDSNRFYRPKCTFCEIRSFCMQGCLGAQYEETGECFANIESVCNLFKQSFDFLINKYMELGILDYILNPTFENYKPILAQEILNYFKAKELKNDKIKREPILVAT